MTKLSVNINKIATLRNTRDNNIPDLLKFTRIALDAGAQGITIHPRPDERHIRTSDVAPLTREVRARGIELNFEGNPFEGKYLELCLEHRPDQATLVPDTVAQGTSDHGWNLSRDVSRLRPVIEKLRGNGCRVSLFMDFDSTEVHFARELGAERIELYTEPFAKSPALAMQFGEATRKAIALGLGVNAGHDLNLENLGVLLKAAPMIAEVSIGHALIGDALEFGLAGAIKKYLSVIREATK
ncbi:MAG TPA: pyridoxine 5'-phosphate synthase [Tepidisphaeraceae bacterium]|nr:pyridoxine 5'-phosphate synthase [Tepidisphaeraceae bacterium]